MAQEYAPERLDVLVRLSNGLERLGLYPEMLRIAERAVLEIGEKFETLQCLAVACYRMHDIQRAIDTCRKVLAIRTDAPVVFLTLGAALHEAGNTDDAVAAYRRALKLKPDYADALFHLGLINLMRGRYRDGWQGFEQRLRLAENKNMRPCVPPWNGTSLRGRTMLLMRDQGLGDEIMYASCYPQIIRDAGRCLIECDPRLERLFVRSFPGAQFFPLEDLRTNAQTEPGVAVDVRSYAAHLPRYLRNSLRDFPHHQGYLKADAARTAHWRERLAGLGRGGKVGISWRGGTAFTKSGKRSLTLADLRPVLAVPGVHWVNLQYGERAADIAAFREAHGIAITDWPEAIDGDYDETAALVGALDLVISVCTSVVHLSGALGQRVWVMAPRVPEWRYGLEGETMPWYPTARVLRQEAAGAWAGVVTAVAERLGQEKW